MRTTKTNPVLPLSMVLLASMLLAACTDAPSPDAASRQAGEALDPIAAAARMAAIQRAAMTGDQVALQGQMEALTDDVRRSMRMPDPARRIPHEPARSAAKTVAGVRNVVWLDQRTLMVAVDGAQYRSMTTIDAICRQLEPLGDTLWVTVSLQNALARTGEALESLHRNCQLPPGQRSFMETPKALDAIDPALREHQRTTGRASNSTVMSPGDAEALRNIPEM